MRSSSDQKLIFIDRNQDLYITPIFSCGRKCQIPKFPWLKMHYSPEGWSNYFHGYLTIFVSAI
ncbi:hypothetical protein Mapa_010540 [Marchantia paleacea]|nr:hypothetical protein Mapa_010540 [Marchantia paleacea]